jgi:hypothetical protein
MWRNFREKQIDKYIGAYLVFILLNYILCLAPIGASYYFSTQAILISSFFAYCFTLLAVTVFPFLYFPKENVGGTIWANVAIVITIISMIAYMVLFILYNYAAIVTSFFNTNIVNALALTFMPALIISLGLSIPVIRSQVAAEKPKKVITTINKLETEGDGIRNEISQKGI